MAFILSSPVSHYSHSPQNHYQRFTPSHSSPLAPKPSFTNALPSPPSSPLSKQSGAPPRRSFKPNPLRASREQAREQRRQLFLNKVRESRDERRFKERGGEEEIVRLMWVSEQRRNEKLLEMEARRQLEGGMFTSIEDEVEDAELEELLRQEEQEMEALIEYFTGSDQNQAPQHHQEVEDFGMDVDMEEPSMGGCAHAENYPCPCGSHGAYVEMEGETVCFNCGWTIRQ